jgi:hypothetical protein
MLNEFKCNNTAKSKFIFSNSCPAPKLSPREKIPVASTDDIAEFVGPVKLEKIPGKGRGLIAMEDLKKGDTVMCTKALALFTKKQSNGCESSVTSFGIGDNDGDMMASMKPGHEYVVGQIANMIMLDPQLGKSVNQLWARSDLKYLEESDPAADKVDVKRINRIVQMNSFGTKYVNIGDKKGLSWSGLWLMPSYINHSCSEANCALIRYGDIVQIVASRVIKAGEQLLISYVGPNDPYEWRKKSCESQGKLMDSIC